ncbi:RNA-binding cell elongation regulator Jag/EloR [Paenibacillus flagellatus]|uniref:RNA-binding protein KhpB n=1 Tax=Paenibacillus flagellatus TaxID=2211139 RepID=A0A2V5JZM7_9BACL|nr:RNA-binding cell elongation regulator Jag/EloR [Paenibacillus flagellatus]PYI52385.1 protein jag [Paenibacillus flagellatus]
MKTIVVTGKTIEEAVKSGLAKWNVPEERVKVQVLEQPSKGLFGLIGSKDAKVELELIPDALEEAVLFLGDVFRTMNIQVTIDRVDTVDGVQFNLSGKELGILIGRRGQTLDSLQYLVNIVANRYSDSHVRIVLDAENFRGRRKQTLEELSDRLAKRVIRTRKEVVLEPMSAQERKVIHSQLQNHPEVKTFSKGEEPNRRVVIAIRQ